MSRYFCLYFDHGDHVYAADHLQAADDDDALHKAVALNVKSFGAGFELWQERRKVLVRRNPRRR